MIYNPIMDKTQINMWVEEDVAEAIRTYAVIRSVSIGDVVAEMVTTCQLRSVIARHVLSRAKLDRKAPVLSVDLEASDETAT